MIRIRKTFIVIAWLLAIVLIYMGIKGLYNRRYNPNQSIEGTVLKSGAVEIILKPNDQHAYVVSGWINDHPVVFLVDTGASKVTLSEKLANRLHLTKENRLYATTANGRVLAYSTTIKSIKLGKITLRNIRAVINPGMHDNVALLGMNALQRLSFHQSGKLLIIRQNPS